MVDPSPGESLFVEGSEVTVTAAPSVGWIFCEWQGGVSGDENPLTFTIADDTAITAVFKEEFSLTLDIDGLGSIDPEAGTYTHLDGESITLTATPEVEWCFTEWQGSFASQENPMTFTIEADTAFTALFQPASILPPGCAAAGYDTDPSIPWADALAMSFATVFLARRRVT